MKLNLQTIDKAAQRSVHGMHCRAPDATDIRRLSPAGFPLWLDVSILPTGGAVTWDAQHGDHCVYVLSGSVEVEGEVVGDGGAAIVEADAATTLRALQQSSIAHFGPVAPAQPRTGLYGAAIEQPRGVHIIPPSGRYVAKDGEPIFRFFADSTCQTCRTTLLYVERDATYVSHPHRHTQDELIFVLRGEIRLGRAAVAPAGTCLAFEGSRAYSFTAGSDGFAFLNYRADVSLYQPLNAPTPRVEAGFLHGREVVGHRYIPTARVTPLAASGVEAAT